MGLEIVGGGCCGGHFFGCCCCGCSCCSCICHHPIPAPIILRRQITHLDKGIGCDIAGAEGGVVGLDWDICIKNDPTSMVNN